MLKVDDTALILVDYQGKLARVMHENEDLHQKMVSLVKGIQVLDIPIIWLEQYPQGLGPTTPEIKELLAGEEPIAKMDFSACQHEDFQAKMEELNKKSYLVAGIEAHICVYQTVKELLEEDVYVEYVRDAISSRTAENKHVAIDKMNVLGAFPTSVEMALFELMGSAAHPKFKQVSKLIK